MSVSIRPRKSGFFLFSLWFLAIIGDLDNPNFVYSLRLDRFRWDEYGDFYVYFSVTGGGLYLIERMLIPMNVSAYAGLGSSKADSMSAWIPPASSKVNGLFLIN